VVNGRLFFGVNSGFTYQESDFQLWSTDGTEAGTSKVTDAPMYVDITSMAPNAMHVFAGAGNYFTSAATTAATSQRSALAHRRDGGGNDPRRRRHGPRN
jgi:ELWxxDGT repeat protein